VASAACDGAEAIGRTMLSCFGECCGEDFPSDDDGLVLPVATSSASGHRLAPDGTIRPVAAAAPAPLPPPQLSDLSAAARSTLAAAGPALTVLDANDGWLVIRDNRNPAVRLRWLRRTDGVLTWAQPTPPLRPLPSDVARIAACGEPARLGGAAAELVSPDAAPLAPAHQSTAPPTPLFGIYVAAEAFFGAPADAAYPASRTGITGCPPPAGGDGLARLRRTVALLAPEWTMYPPELFSAAGVLRIIFCEELRYNGQRRRDVPDLASGNLYVDVGDRSPRRKRHSLHHELWHMIDYRLRGASFAAADAEWEAANKPGFRYGLGGKHMRSDAASSQLASAPDGHFLNRYCTSAIMEDKAEVWAALMCYALTLSTEPLRAKGRLLQKRAAELCPLLNDAWWESVYTAQATRQNLWERHASPDNGTIYHHYLTGEVRTEADPPEGWSIDSA